MTIYIFKRMKKTGLKKVTKEVEDVEEARKICGESNLANHNYWMEFTEDIEYTKNPKFGGRMVSKHAQHRRKAEVEQ